MIRKEDQAKLDALLGECLLSMVEDSTTQGAWKVRDLKPEDDASQREFCMLTLASYQVKAIATLFFSTDDWLRQFVGRQIGSDKLSTTQFYGYISETSNNFASLIKRGLAQTRCDFGMSTPNILGFECSEFFSAPPCRCERLRQSVVRQSVGVY